MWVPLASQSRVKVTGPEKVPEKITPLGAPFVPLPVMVNQEPEPPANVPPPAKEPDNRAPVPKLTVPRSPAIGVPASGVIIASVDPLSVSPLLEPDSIPPTLV